MRVIGGGQRHAGEQGGRREQAGQGGEGEAAAMDANRRGQDGRANGEEIRTTATAKEKQKEQAMHGIDTVPAMVVAAKEGRMKRRKRRHR